MGSIEEYELNLQSRASTEADTL
ncbi:3f2c3ed0-2c29-496b-a685-696ab7bd6cb8 [Thermothielavioides terrestris]|uniref:3f2c3ed0-2c29-496b-a685-696ab7bd6cb8 n=1 Tax=Thermothielavioides terrestris TaxID=2587410 RepID=A0A3S4AYN6_9PEZI|nr:3f2c3ed0-2c29-496b-a685-696ab7bd6cb8 [Thermothielavioides terrestris]